MSARSRFFASFLVPLLAVLALAAPPLARAASPLCSSVGSDQNYEWVTRVAINGVSVSIPKTGYHDATGAALATLQAGQSYTVAVDVATDGTQYLEYVKFWFDQNQNGAIEDPAELVFDQNANFATFRTFSGPITIPPSAYNGPMYVRMIMQYNASPALCGGYTYGTTVDLLVNVTGATANPTAPAAPTAVTAVAGNASAAVSFTPSVSSGVIGYTVTSSPGGLTATGAGSPITVSGLTNGTTYTFTVSAQKSATVFSDPSSPSNAVTPQSVVNGACGAHNGATLTTTPTSLCSAGSASGVTTGTTDYTWSCAGSGGGSTASCSATRNYPVTSTVASGSGTISASQNVAYNATPSFTVTPNAGSVIQSVTGCGGSLSGNTYTTAPVTAACGVSATFIAQVNGACGADHGTSRLAAPSALCSAGTASAVTTGNAAYDWSCAGTNGGSTAACSATRLYTVSSSVASGTGTISASQNVAYNATPSFTVTPGAGWVIQSVTGCGGSLSGSTYTTGAVTASCSVSATFAAVVNGACGADHGGALVPTPTALCGSGTASAVTASNTAWSWTCAGANTGTTASCAADRRYRLTATATAGGSIAASRDASYLEAPAFAVTPAAGYLVQSVTGCGGTFAGTPLAGGTYSTAPVTASCTIAASFVGNVPPAAGAVTLAGPNAVIRYGETLTGRYTFSDADGDGEDTGASGSAYRFVRSATSTPPAPGQGQAVASGRTGGSARTYAVQAADVGQHLFYCVTPKAAAGDPTPGAEACSAATPAIQRATQAITLTPPPAVTLGTSGTVTLSGGPSSQPVTLVSTTPSVCTVNGLTVTAVGPGTCTLVATQGGDSAYEAPAPVTVTIAVDRLLPALALSATPAMGDYRAPLTLVLDASGTFGRVGGEVAFLLDGTPIAGCAKVALDRGRAQCVTNRVPAGRHAVLARFAGDTNYLAADSAPAAILVKTVNPAARNRDTRGDGRTSIFFETPAGGLAILTSNDNAPLDGQQLLPDGSGWRVVGFADFDGAGTSDLVLRHADGRHQLWALDGIGIVSRVDFTGLARDAAIEAIADFDGDGKDDLLVKAADGSLAIWTMDGPAVKSVLPFAGPADALAFLAVADLDADGGKDLVLATVDGIRLQKLAAGLAEARTDHPWPAAGWRLANLGDFDGDGRTDLVFEGPAGGTAILRLDGLAAPRRSDLAIPAGWRIVDVVDFDADFADDLVLEGPAGEISIATVGAALAITGTSTVPADAGWRLVQVADFDGDGGLDLLFASAAGELKSLRYRNGIFLGTVVLSHPTSWTVIP